MEKSDLPFVHGCGALIVGNGDIIGLPQPTTASSDQKAPHCVWYVKSESDDHSLLLRNMDNNNADKPPYSLTVTDFEEAQFSIS